jgi:aldehyde dehydrogenase (NAD+)
MANPGQEIKYTKLFINNRFVDAKSGKTFATVNPTTGKVLAQIAEADKYDVDFAVEAARKAVHRGSPWRLLEGSVRGQLLHRLADFMKRDLEILANLETLDTGKLYVDAVRDVTHSIETLRYYAGYTDKLHGRTIPTEEQDLFTYTRKEPIGVVGLIATFEHPIVSFAQQVGPALAAGSTIVYKPSIRGPLTTLHAAHLFIEVGFPEGVFNVVTGHGSIVGQAIANHEQIRHITFSGKKEVGKLVMESAARSNLKKVSLLLGGKNPLIVLNDTDVEEAAHIAHRAVFKNGGQSPFAAGRIYVHEDIYDKFLKHTLELVRKRTVGNPFEKDAFQGPLIDQTQVEQYLQWIEIAKKDGAKLEFGGKRVGTVGHFAQPTVFTNVTDDMRIAKEELYGPIMVLLRFKTLDEIIERSNKLRYGMAAGIITRDWNRSMYLTRRLDVGTVWLNTWNEFVTQGTFGGHKESGHGRFLGREAIEQYLETKTVVALMETVRPERH